MKHLFTLVLMAVCLGSGFAQIKNPVKWNSELKHIDGDKFELIFKAKIDKNWAVYSMYLDRDDGPIATNINYDYESGFKLVGEAKEIGDKKSGYDAIFDMNLVKFANNYTITQAIEVKDYSKPIMGYLNFMTCDDEQCLPPTDVDFTHKPVKGSSKGDTGSVDKEVNTSDIAIDNATEDMGEGVASLDGPSMDDLESTLLQPVKWEGRLVKKNDDTYLLRFKAVINPGWQIYSQFIDEEEGPVPTSFVIEGNQDNISRISPFSESSEKELKEYDEFFQMELLKFKQSATFEAELEIKDPIISITGYLEFMACNDRQCIPPLPLEFSINGDSMTVTIFGQEPALSAGFTKGEGTPVYADFDYEFAKSGCEDTGPVEEENTGWLWIFIFGFLGGLLAILTPCVFPMIPLTISYFTKSSSNKAQGIKNASIYGISIIVIYLVLGLLITGIFGADALNLLSTNAWFNIFFGILFIVFGISFFGYFEITLPSSWVNRADEASDKGGLIGIFFMAFTLSLVSFSCTGPIIGTLLVETAVGNTTTILGRIPLNPLIGMFGFSLALALPFGLFAAFPGWLNTLPRSGNWMNTIKVTLGFAEIALALKFFSIADLTMGWKILPYEAFVFLWIICALALGAYYLGIFKFPHEAPVKSISNLRKVWGLLMIALAIYFATGFRYSEKSGSFVTPNLLSGLAPPAGHSYIYPIKCPLNLNCFKDYYEGIEHARKVGKPVMIDFTGHGCVNCRRMEDQVWGKPGIYDMLNDRYVIISLYVDERKALDEPYTSAFDERIKRTVGNKWADFQAIHFNRNSQPYYVLSTADGQILNEPVAYTPDVNEYRKFLECGLKRYEALK